MNTTRRDIEFRLDPIHPEGQGHSPEDVELDSLMVQLRETCLFELESFLQVSRTYDIRTYFHNNVIFPEFTGYSDSTWYFKWRRTNKSAFNTISYNSLEYYDSGNATSGGLTSLSSYCETIALLDVIRKTTDLFPNKPGILLGRGMFDANIDYFITVDNITDHTYQVYKVANSRPTLVNSFNFNDLIVFILDWRLEYTL